MKIPQYQWQGEPVEVKFGMVIQYENTDKPIYWYNFECHTKERLDGSREIDHFVDNKGRHFALIPAIEVIYGKEKSFLLANHFGIAVSKLLKGGWPNHTHFSLEGKFEESCEPYFKITEFDLEGFEHHESERNKWQKQNFPVEYERLEALRRGAQQYKSTQSKNI